MIHFIFKIRMFYRSLTYDQIQWTFSVWKSYSERRAWPPPHPSRARPYHKKWSIVVDENDIKYSGKIDTRHKIFGTCLQQRQFFLQLVFKLGLMTWRWGSSTEPLSNISGDLNKYGYFAGYLLHLWKLMLPCL